MEKAKIFQSIVKGSNFFTPIVDSYHTIGNHIIELSCSEKDNQHGLYNREVNGITFKGKYGSNLKEAAYHRKVRIRAIKRGDTIVEGNVIETKSKYPINVFENESSKKVSK